MATLERWTELLACPNCGMSGLARFSKPEKRPFEFSVESVPEGFKVVRVEFGETFYCKSCDQQASHK